MKILSRPAVTGAVIRGAILAVAVLLAALVHPLHGLAALAAVSGEAAAVSAAPAAGSPSHAHEDCGTAAEAAAAACAHFCASAVAVLSPPIALSPAESLAAPASRQPLLRRGRHHPLDPRPPRRGA